MTAMSIAMSIAMGIAVVGIATGIGCRGQREPPAGDDGDRPAATPRDLPDPDGAAQRADDDPFAGPLASLRPADRVGWPLENVDIERYAGWRISPVDGTHERVEALVFASDPGAFVLAIADGRVLEVETEDDGRATVTVDHGRGIESRLGPLAESSVHAGLPVRRGALLGLATADTLALEVRVDGVAIDPLLAIRQPLHRWPALLRRLPPPPPEPDLQGL